MSTYLSLTNQLLRRLNENEIGSTGWSATRGVQSLAKDAIQAAVRKINFVEFEWPFNAVETTATLVIGQNEYSWPTNFKNADWNSFVVLANEDFGNNTKPLYLIDRDEWYANLKPNDMDAGANGVAIPQYIFESHGTGFGVSPSPDKAYQVRYRYYRNPTTMNASTDDSGIPDQYDDIIVQAGLFHMYMFRGNTEQAQEAEGQFLKMLNSATSILIHKINKVRSSMVAWGRNSDGGF